ncbi:unnamed protein product [Clavelina lepadiformis]|uniref:Fibronectin type-III domain-containing protein n=1 Tax=Clavelina lepadiformis TaxID=159417 RepID=A0ABP0GQ07_CLALP
MELKYGGVLVLYLFIGTCSTELIVPQPTVYVEQVTPYAIILNWTMPLNENADGFTVEAYSSNTKLDSFDTSETRQVIEGLNPGEIYTFLLKAYRGDMESKAVIVLQDTVPLPPSNLRLDTFSKLAVTLESAYAGTIHVTLDVNGIEVVWEGPSEGVCDCYSTSITPPDGRVALPASENREMPPSLLRQFIYLLPGQKYTIGVSSSTCGKGRTGTLLSDEVIDDVILPPSPPTEVKAKDVTNTSLVLSWKEGEIPGLYDNFNVTLVGDVKSGITIETPDDVRSRDRKVTGLQPCRAYQFSVYTMSMGVHSESGENAEVTTRPTTPYALRVTDFDETTISVAWRITGRHGTAGVRIYTQDGIEVIREITDREAAVGSLKSGTFYNISVSTFCETPTKPQVDGERFLESEPATVSQVTVPLEPSGLTGYCDLKGDEKSILYFFWAPPTSGRWDGFVLDYSPFAFEDGNASPLSPMVLPLDTYTTNVTLPTSGRRITAMVRTVSSHILSKPVAAEIICGNDAGKAALRCRMTSVSYNIVVKRIEDGRVCVAVTDNPIVNITVETSHNPLETFVTDQHEFCLDDPCEQAGERIKLLLRVLVYPECKSHLSCPPIPKKLCQQPGQVEEQPQDAPEDPDAHPTTPPPVQPNGCCNGVLYNTGVRKCCHDKLVSYDNENLLCCYNKWYDRTKESCCGNENGVGMVQHGTTCILPS